MTIYLIPNMGKENIHAAVTGVTEAFQRFGATVLLPSVLAPNFASSGAEFCPEAEAFQRCDVVVTVGGDGTILHAAKRGLSYQKPLLGINMGRVGFLATAESYELDKLERLVRGDWHADRRTILSVHCAGREDYQGIALNDLVISKCGIGQTIDVQIFCDGTLVNEYLGDGVVVATPTGSTAYSLSAGGPVLDARISGLVVTPVCAHSMHSPPMVFSAERHLTIRVLAPVQGCAVMCCDGSDERQILPDDRIEVALGERAIFLVSFSEADQFEAIDKKLKGR